jgi:hypothetical protein
MSATDPGPIREDEPIIDAETVIPEGDETPPDDPFFPDDKGFKPITVKAQEDRPLFTDDAIDSLISAIKEALRVEGVDEHEFKSWLFVVGPKKTPPRKYVGLKFGNLSLHEGNMGDLKKLHGEINPAIRTFMKWRKEQSK